MLRLTTTIPEKRCIMALPANVNLASKFSNKLDQAFKRNSYTDAYVNKDYDFDGVSTVKIYSLDTTNLTDYDVSSTSDRYGGFTEITDTVQIFTLANDVAFKKALDKLNMDDSMQAKKAAEWLALEMNQVVVPTIDKNVFATAWTAAAKTGAGGIAELDADTAGDFLAQIRDINADCDEVSCPMDGRVLFLTPTAYNKLKKDLDTMMTNAGSTDQVTSRGFKGNVDGVPVVVVPQSYFPAASGTTPNKVTPAGLFWHKSAILSCRKLTETRIKTDSELVSGNLIIGRFRYDCFDLVGSNGSGGEKTKLKTIHGLKITS
jgi:hypothetical protein